MREEVNWQAANSRGGELYVADHDGVIYRLVLNDSLARLSAEQGLIGMQIGSSFRTLGEPRYYCSRVADFPCQAECM